MLLAGHHVVGGVETDPAEAGQEGFHPGVGGIGPLAHATSRPVIEIAGDVARGDAPPARHRDHDVGEVLADAAADFQRVVDGRMDLRDPRLVGEGSMDRMVQGRERGEGIAVRLDEMHLVHEGP